jgi:antirestriction protein ArdC
VRRLEQARSHDHGAHDWRSATCSRRTRASQHEIRAFGAGLLIFLLVSACVIIATELGHWTGTEKRLDRTFGKKFGDQAYSAEELVAELTPAFLCGEFGFDNNGVDADYIAHWVSFLTDHSGAIVTAAAAASRALAFMRDLALEDDETLEPLALAA